MARAVPKLIPTDIESLLAILRVAMGLPFAVIGPADSGLLQRGYAMPVPDPFEIN